jgi:hypothetical protein
LGQRAFTGRNLNGCSWYNRLPGMCLAGAATGHRH